MGGSRGGGVEGTATASRGYLVPINETMLMAYAGIHENNPTMARLLGGKMVIIGIDPGAAGAIAWVRDGRLVTVQDMPTMLDSGGKGKSAALKRRVDGVALARLLRDCGPIDMLYLERATAMPGQGVVSMFAFGVAYGAVLGVAGALQIPVTIITASQWKAAMHCAADKRLARLRATQLMPYAAEHWSRVRDHGRAEAALIALYGSRQFKPEIDW
jgi:crossover junction endodeoxyribonuclease RuvC